MNNFEKYLKELRRTPELAFEEKKTTKKIEKILKNMGLTFNLFKDITGGYVDVGEGIPKVAVRTDIDAIIVDQGGKKVVKHACGHDIHMATTLCVIEKLITNQIKTPVRFIFQPAEEIGQGAKAVIKTGILNTIEYLYGMHVRPLEELPLGKFSPSILHGASKMIEGEIKGQDAHAARPHLTSNAIEVGFGIMHEIYRIHSNPMIPASAKFTSFHSDAGAHNTIPGDASFTIDIRAQDNGTMTEITKKINDIMKAVELLSENQIKIKEITNLKAAEAHETAVTKIREAIIETLGEESLEEEITTPGGEDFHEYTYQLKKLKATMLGIGCGVTPGLHHPNMRLNQEQAMKSVQILYNLLKKH